MNTVNNKIDVNMDYSLEIGDSGALDSFDWSTESINGDYTIIRLM